MKTSFTGDRDDIHVTALSSYRKPEYKDSGEIIIHKGNKNIELVRPFFAGGRNSKSRYWLEAFEKFTKNKSRTIR